MGLTSLNLNPRDEAMPLTQFQQAWVNDRSRFKIANKARRIGFTFASTLEIALDAIDRRTRWLIVSRTQDTAKEAVREISTHFRAMKEFAAAEAPIQDHPTEHFWDGVQIHKFVVELPNGSEIIALTAHPDAARGFGGNVLLDEHGFHRDSKELWKGASAAVLRGHRLIVVSTPHYQLGNYHELARKAGLTVANPPGQAKRGIWSAHFVDIVTAAPQLAEIGVPPFWLKDESDPDDPGRENVAQALADVRELAGDDDTWNQEYLGQFLSAAEMWIALELIAAARSTQAWTTWDAERNYDGTLYVGADIGRKRDATQIWIMERIGQASYLRGLIPMIRAPFSEQFTRLCEVIGHPKVRRACIDSTGIGMQLAEDLRRKFGMKVEPITFTREIKEKMAVGVKRRMEEKLLKIPEMAPEIERDFAAIKRETTASGNIRFDADRQENSHADIFWAAALAELAADSGVQAACVRSEADQAPIRERLYERPSIWNDSRRLSF